MKKPSKIPAILLAFCLLLGMLPGAALAADGTLPFTDVPETAWYHDAVQYVYERGMMGGSGSMTTFLPEQSTSRGMLVTILYRMEGSPAAGRALFFEDVPAGQWYTDAVAWGAANEIVNGSDGKFRPDDPVTREQMAAILYRYVRYKGYAAEAAGDTSAFLDGDAVSPYAADAVSWAVGIGLLQGTDNMLTPAGGATRAQAATVLMRFSASYTLTTVSAMDVMCEPRSILFLEDGSFLVADTYNKVIWLVMDGVSEVYAGSETVEDPYGRPIGGYNDAALTESYFKRPWAITPFLDGYAVSDADNDVVRLIQAEITQTVNGRTEENLAVTDLGVAFSHPTGLATDEEGNLYVSDTYEGAVRKVTPEGIVTTFASGLTEPMGLCWQDGTLYIAEAGANRIVKTTGGSVTVVAGSGEEDYVDGPADEAAFHAPQGVTVGEDGTVYVSDTANGAVRQVRGGVVTTLARRDVSDLTAFVPNSPIGLAVHGNGLYVCDSFARKIFVINLTQ